MDPNAVAESATALNGQRNARRAVVQPQTRAPAGRAAGAERDRAHRAAIDVVRRAVDRVEQPDRLGHQVLSTLPRRRGSQESPHAGGRAPNARPRRRPPPRSRRRPCRSALLTNHPEGLQLPPQSTRRRRRSRRSSSVARRLRLSGQPGSDCCTFRRPIWRTLRCPLTPPTTGGCKAGTEHRQRLLRRRRRQR